MCIRDSSSIANVRLGEEEGYLALFFELPTDGPEGETKIKFNVFTADGGCGEEYSVRIVSIFDEQYYDNLKGGILEAFGNIFKNNMKIYLYPLLDKENGGIINSDNLKLEDNMKEFYKYFKVNNKIRDLDYNEEFLKILSKDILKQIKKNEPGWEDKVPKAVSEMIIKNKMFGYK